jgi:hypothetical protein
MILKKIQRDITYPNFIKEILKKTGEKLVIEKDNLEELGDDELCAIIAFLTVEDAEWEIKNIIKSLKHFMDYKNKINLSILSNDKNKLNKINLNNDKNNIYENNNFFINKNNENFDCYDTCMIFDYILNFYYDEEKGYLKIKNKKINISEVNDENKLKLLFYFSLSDYSDLDSYVFSIIKKNKKINILELSSFLNFNYEKKEVEEDKKKYKRKILTSPFLNANISDEEAIGYMFKCEKIDISYAEHVYDEFKHYFYCKSEGIIYSPKNENMKIIYERNKNFFYIEKFFRRDFDFYYAKDNIEKLKEYEGIKDANFDVKDYYTESKIRNIYLGYIPNKNPNKEKKVYQSYLEKDIKTYIYNTNINEIKINELFSFGEENKFIYLSLKEIIDFLKNKEDYISFTNDGVRLTEYSIMKLKNILKEEKIIQNIEEKNKKRLDYFENIKDKFIKLDDIKKNICLEYILNVFNFAMKLRGWDGDINKYTLKKTDKIVSFENINTIKECDNINTYRNLISNIEFIKDLKILKINNNDFYLTNILLYERYLSIIEVTENDDSCIKTGSNYIIYTCYYYYKLFKNEELINLSLFEEL